MDEDVLKEAVRCWDTGFRVPTVAKREILYIANLKSLFLGNDEQTAELKQLVGELDSYGGRLASVLNLIYPGENNVLVLERPPEPALLDYFRSGLKLSLPRILVLSHADYEQSIADSVAWLKTKLTSRVQWVDGYVTDAVLIDWANALEAKTVSTLKGSRIGNNKANLHQFLHSTGLPVPDTFICQTPDQLAKALGRLEEMGYRNAVARSAIGASGIGMLKVKFSEAAPLSIPEQFFHGGPCLAQGWFEDGVLGVTQVQSPSVQLFLDDGSVQLFDTTNQILSEGSVHEGNQSPPEGIASDTQGELIRQAKIVGRWLSEQGYRGTASVDFLVVERNGKPTTVYVCEVNARITGATYPSLVGRHLLPGGAWLMRNMRFQYPIEGDKLLELIDLAGALFYKGREKGVVPLNFNFGSDGLTRKGQFLCLGESVSECWQLLERLISVLPSETTLDRD